LPHNGVIVRNKNPDGHIPPDATGLTAFGSKVDTDQRRPIAEAYHFRVN
jgi:hypothetical protein